MPLTPRDTWLLPAHHVGRRVLVFDSVDSTNTVAASLADDPANHGTAVLAGEQTAGRGQYGRTWHSPPELGVWLSVLLFPAPHLRRPALLTAWAAVAAADTARTLTRLPTSIKWPNDVLLAGRKVCGILIEQARGTVVGMGLNVNQTADQFTTAGLPQATSLAAASGRLFDRDTVARRLLADLDAGYDLFVRGDVESLEAAWRDHLGLLGELVVIETADGTSHCGQLRALSFAGLEYVTQDGTISRLAPEAVRAMRRDEGMTR